VGPGINEVFNVALRQKSLPTPALDSLVVMKYIISTKLSWFLAHQRDDKW